MTVMMIASALHDSLINETLQGRAQSVQWLLQSRGKQKGGSLLN
jgi:hypothetical protein